MCIYIYIYTARGRRVQLVLLDPPLRRLERRRGLGGNNKYSCEC